MKKALLTIGLFFTLQAIAQTELIDTSSYVKLDETLYKSVDGRRLCDSIRTASRLNALEKKLTRPIVTQLIIWIILVRLQTTKVD